MWKSRCQLLGSGDPVSKSQSNISLTECCCEPFCERQTDAIMHKEFHQQFVLHSVVGICQIDRHGQSLFLPLESFADIVCESDCVFPRVFSALYPPWFGGSTFLLSKSRASFLTTIRSIRLPVVFCIVRIRYSFSLLWSFPGFGTGLRLLCDQSSGTCPVVKLSGELARMFNH